MLKNKVLDYAYFGGTPLFNKVRTTMNIVKPNKKKFLEYAKVSFDLAHLSNNGPNVQALERELAKLHEVDYCVVFANCFFAMTLALKAMAHEGKNEVIMPSLTYRRMTDIVLWAGLTPHFCEVNSDRAICVETIEPCISDNTAVILAPHPITSIAEVDKIETLARQYSLPLLIDAVEACGGRYKGRKIGSFGDAEAFSMHPSKVLNSAEGGYITTNNFELAEKLRYMRSFGFTGQDNIECLGLNLKLNEIHAALARSCIFEFEKTLAENKAQHMAYRKNLEDIDGLELIQYDLSEAKNCKSCLVHLTDKWKLSRSYTLDILNKENIFARPYYYPALHNEAQKRGLWEKSLNHTEKLAEEYMILPMGSSVSLEDIDKIGLLLKNIAENASELYGIPHEN